MNNVPVEVLVERAARGAPEFSIKLMGMPYPDGRGGMEGLWQTSGPLVGQEGRHHGY